MPVNNPWVKYIDRTYEQIKAAVLLRLGLSNPEITDHSESNPLVIILSFFAGALEMLGYYIDNMAREAFLATARRFTSVIKLAKQLDYRVKAINPASVDIYFTLLDGAQAPINLGTNTLIPAGTEVQTANGTKFITTQSLVVPAGQSTGVVGAIQVVAQSGITLGTSNGLTNQAFAIGTDYVHSSLGITIGVDVWVPLTSFGFAKPTDKVFVVNIHENGIAYAEFGDGTFGAIPPVGQDIIGSYTTSIGADANTIQPQTITTLNTALVLPGVSTIKVTNYFSPSGGRNYESIENIRFRAPLSLRTLERAVTYQDYIDVALLANGVIKAEVSYCCGSCITIYILPENGGLASLGLLNATKDFICDKKIITTCVSVKAAGTTVVALQLTVNGNFRQDPLLIRADVIAALVAFGSYDNQKINGSIKLSDIYAVVNNLDRVDFSNIISISTIPYARPQDANYNQLNWVRQTLITSASKNKYRLEYNGLGNFALSKNGNYLQNLIIGQNFTDENIDFEIQIGIYGSGNVWEFTTYPANRDINLDDYTIPILDPNNIDLTVIETSSTLNCKPNCPD